MRFMLMAAAALFAASCATANDAGEAPPMPTDRDCFFADQINGYGTIDDRTVRVSVGANRDYALTLFSDASELRFENAIAVRSDSSWICTGNGLGVEVYSLDRTFSRSWPVTQIVRLPDEPPAEAAPEAEEPPQGS